MPKYQIEREGQTFSTFFSFFLSVKSNFYNYNHKKLTPI